MDFLAAHWHCIAPVVAGAALLAYTLLPKKGKKPADPGKAGMDKENPYKGG